MPAKSHVSLLKGTPFITGRLFFCPSCSQIRRFCIKPVSSPKSIRKRYASTFPGASIVSATKNIPERFQDLYKALEELKNTSASYVDSSRLQLAQRGIESENPMIRIAVLGLGGTKTAAKLVRLLLADPLGPKEDWETLLDSRSNSESGSFLIRYGDKFEVSSANNLLPTILISSSLLHKANLEILVSPLGTNIASSSESFAASLQAATIAIPSTDGTPDTHIRYPVHRSIICGDGIDGLFAYGRLAGKSKEGELGSTRAVFQLGLNKAPEKSEGEVSFVDIDCAEVALDKFRQSAQNATDYQEGWDRSGIQPIIDWLSAGSTDQAVSPDLRNLLDSVLKEADTKIEQQEKKKLADMQASSVPEEVRNSLDVTISEWAERAHGELQSSLDEAFRCRSWRSLVWWKLFWRVDDVPMICSNLLRKQWLVQAEKEALWIGGRFQQARLLEDDSASDNGKYPPATEGHLPDQFPSTPGFTPWKTQITEGRNSLISSSIMPLHSLAQSLVTFSMSTTGLTSALSALTYISTTTTSLSEAGTFAAVGLIYSLWRQQKKWDLARKTWEIEIREEGRKALRHTEDSMRLVVRDGNRPAMPPIEKEAKDSIRTAKQALSNVL
ncbi:hypothetical protein McanMca71_006646 [Microsporum canis]|uniref:Mmc1 C-terminal domain-containing protein n=1 Tax=Arthroderma otae (strain ATCC MYA-4605 / CBS 113480) TaxID=554155 RepID=C5FIH3_ARTOC|nr:conserved hypothetical protein [Microsporum canis CBS 113480]EEQ29242.1 conserved hypothetical protein [Microsporum canis CBS 113480]